MNIVHLNDSDVIGGAARAAFRLHGSLLEEGVSSRMLVLQRKRSSDPMIERKLSMRPLRRRLENLWLKKYPKRCGIFSVNLLPSFGLASELKRMRADILHIHWVGASGISIAELARVKIPIVWSLHDLWPFTGGCHYTAGCRRFESHCGHCPVLGSNREGDLSSSIQQAKRSAFSGLENLTIVGLSKWIAAEASRSSVFKGRNIVNLPNPIDTRIYYKRNKEEARAYFNLPVDGRKLILFGAADPFGDPRKGFHELREAMSIISDKDVELVVLGAGEGQAHFKSSKVHSVGHVDDDDLLAKLYSAVDVFVLPSREENLSNMLVEAKSCSTPLVAFDVGGNRDIINNRSIGLLAAPLSAVSLAACIREVLTWDGRADGANEFEARLVVGKYLELYRQILRSAVS